MVGWHHQLNRHEFEQALGVGDGGLVGCRRRWSGTESDTTEATQQEQQQHQGQVAQQ